MMKPGHSPLNVQETDATTSRSQRRSDKAVARTISSASIANGIHLEKSMLGSMIAGHQHSAEPIAIRTSKRVFFLICVLKRKVADRESNLTGSSLKFTCRQHQSSCLAYERHPHTERLCDGLSSVL